MYLLDFLFPRRSITGEEGEWLTDEERRSLQILSPAVLTFEFGSLDRVTACGLYHHAFLLRRAITRWKYNRVRGMEQAFALILERTLVEHPLPADAVLCPVPLHWVRRCWRGFNQAEVLARLISKKTGCPVQQLLSRARSTGHQAHRTGRERRNALRDAFISCGSMPEKVVLVDDVYTTGSTLQECSKMLKKAGAKHVEAIVLALG